MSSRLIGLVGRKQAGKDTVADLLQQAEPFERFSWAAKMKQFALAQNPWIMVRADEWRDWMDALPSDVENFVYIDWSADALFRLADLVAAAGWEEVKKIRDARQFLQRLGTEAGRNVLGTDVWVDAAGVDISATLHSTSVVITDCRFTNELLWVVERGGEIWRIERPDLPADDDQHVSEHEWRSFPANRTLTNSGTIEELGIRVWEILACSSPASPLR